MSGMDTKGSVQSRFADFASLRPMQRSNSRIVLIKSMTLMLLFAVVGLSAVARHGQYLPESDPIHHISSATKMNVCDAPVLPIPAQAHRAITLVPPSPEFNPVQSTHTETVYLPQIGLIVSLQHRSPPRSVS